jgi:excinuclease ABC subunit C
MEELKQRLRLKHVPESIGAFDVSTIHGAHSVGSFVYWSEGGFRKDYYRHLKIRGVAEKADDYAMMEEIVGRVLADLGDERPDMILIDGGRGQLEAARKAVGGTGNPPEVVSIAKDPDRIFITDSPEPTGIEDGSPSSLLLKRIRDEAHRFAITYHKKLRDRGLMESPLLGIKGIGAQKRLELLRHFGSLGAIRNASVDDLAEVKGIDRKLAESIKKFLAAENSDKMGS